MSTTLRIIESPGPHYTGKVRYGDMWRIPGWDRIRNDNSVERECWAIVLPNGHVWHTTDTASGQLWDVSGDPPTITVNPSIDDQDQTAPWHGHIINGVATP